MSIQILDPSVFGIDYSKAEFKTFCYVGNDAEGNEFADLYDYDGFKALCNDALNWQVFSDVMEAIRQGKGYTSFGSRETGDYFEIQWD